MAITPENAPPELIDKLFGDLELEKATAAAIDRVNELMKPATTVPELFLSTNKRREMRYERAAVGHDLGWSCSDPNTYDGDPADGNCVMGYGLTQNEAYVDWLRKCDDEPEPKPRMRLVDGGGGVQPPEYAPEHYVDPDEPQ